MSTLRVGFGDFVIQLVTFSVFAIIGVVGNMRVLCIHTSIMRLTHLRYVAMFMASVDLAQCLLTIPAHLLLISFTFTLSAPTNSLCKAIATMQRFLMVTSSCLLAVLSYERQEKVWHPFSSEEAAVARVRANIIVSFLVGAAASFCSPFYNGVLQYQVNTTEGMKTADLCLYDSSSQDRVVAVFSCTELAFLLAVFLFIVWASGRVCYIMHLYGNTPLTIISMISTNAMLYNSYCMQQQAIPKESRPTLPPFETFFSKPMASSSSVVSVSNGFYVIRHRLQKHPGSQQSSRHSFKYDLLHPIAPRKRRASDSSETPCSRRTSERSQSNVRSLLTMQLRSSDSTYLNSISTSSASQRCVGTGQDCMMPKVSEYPSSLTGMSAVTRMSTVTEMSNQTESSSRAEHPACESSGEQLRYQNGSKAPPLTTEQPAVSAFPLQENADGPPDFLDKNIQNNAIVEDENKLLCLQGKENNADNFYGNTVVMENGAKETDKRLLIGETSRSIGRRYAGRPTDDQPNCQSQRTTGEGQAGEETARSSSFVTYSDLDINTKWKTNSTSNGCRSERLNSRQKKIATTAILRSRGSNVISRVSWTCYCCPVNCCIPHERPARVQPQRPPKLQKDATEDTKNTTLLKSNVPFPVVNIVDELVQNPGPRDTRDEGSAAAPIGRSHRKWQGLAKTYPERSVPSSVTTKQPGRQIGKENRGQRVVGTRSPYSISSDGSVIDWSEDLYERYVRGWVRESSPPPSFWAFHCSSSICFCVGNRASLEMADHGKEIEERAGGDSLVREEETDAEEQRHPGNDCTEHAGGNARKKRSQNVKQTDIAEDENGPHTCRPNQTKLIHHHRQPKVKNEPRTSKQRVLPPTYLSTYQATDRNSNTRNQENQERKEEESSHCAHLSLLRNPVEHTPQTEREGSLSGRPEGRDHSPTPFARTYRDANHSHHNHEEDESEGSDEKGGADGNEEQSNKSELEQPASFLSQLVFLGCCGMYHYQPFMMDPAPDDIGASMIPNLPSNYLRLLSSQMHTTPRSNTEEVKSDENLARISKGSLVFEDSIRMRKKKRSKEKPLTESCSYDKTDEQKMSVSWPSSQPPPRLKTLKYGRSSKMSDESTKSKSMNWAHFVLVLVVLFAALHLLPHGVFIVYLAFHPNPGIHLWTAQSSLLMSLVYRSFFLSCVFNPYLYFDSRIRYDLQRLMKLWTVSEDMECHANKLPLIQVTARATKKPTEPKKGVLKVKEETSARIKEAVE